MQFCYQTSFLKYHIKFLIRHSSRYQHISNSIYQEKMPILGLQFFAFNVLSTELNYLFDTSNRKNNGIGNIKLKIWSKVSALLRFNKVTSLHNLYPVDTFVKITQSQQFFLGNRFMKK